MSKTAKQLDQLLEKGDYFKFLWAMYDELEENSGINSGTIIGRYAAHLESGDKHD
jgi:hypothetical protein